MSSLLQGNKVKDKLKNGQSVKGTFLLTREPACAEILGYAGLDFIIIDTEHTPTTATEVVNIIRATEISGAEPIVRVRNNDEALILQALDLGAKGILVPKVNSADEARLVVRAAKYGPMGERGVAGIVRAACYGFTPADEYFKAANENTFIMVQVEDMDAVHNLDEILAVEGINAIFIGPADLSQSMGLTAQFNNPEFRRTVQHIITRTREAGKPAAIFCNDAEDAKHWEKAGANILTVAGDTMMMAQAVKKLLKDLEK